MRHPGERRQSADASTSRMRGSSASLVRFAASVRNVLECLWNPACVGMTLACRGNAVVKPVLALIQRTGQPRGRPACYVTFGGAVTISVVSDQLVGESAGGGLTEWLVGQITR